MFNSTLVLPTEFWSILFLSKSDLMEICDKKRKHNQNKKTKFKQLFIQIFLWI